MVSEQQDNCAIPDLSESLVDLYTFLVVATAPFFKDIYKVVARLSSRDDTTHHIDQLAL